MYAIYAYIGVVWGVNVGVWVREYIFLRSPDKQNLSHYMKAPGFVRSMVLVELKPPVTSELVLWLDPLGTRECPKRSGRREGCGARARQKHGQHGPL